MPLTGPRPRRYAWPASSRPIRVLLVDDDEASRLLMRIVLRRARAKVIIAEANTAADGIAQASVREPDVVILDLRMPGMTGLEAIPLLRNACIDSKIIVFSDYIEDMSPQQAATLGADLVVRKGPNFALLVPAIMQVHQTGFVRQEAARRRLAMLRPTANPA